MGPGPYKNYEIREAQKHTGPTVPGPENWYQPVQKENEL